MENIQKRKSVDHRKSTKQNFTALLDMVRGDAVLMNYVDRNYPVNAARIKLLEEILFEFGRGKGEEARQKIYMYGSLIKGQDLIARQIFLWLLRMADERESFT